LTPGAPARRRDDYEAGLVARAQGGDREAFAELIVRYAPKVLSVAWRMLGNRAQADDVGQETFLAAFRALPAFRAEARFSTWVYRIAVNKCQDLLRSRRAEVEVPPLRMPDGETERETAGESADHRSPEEKLLDAERETAIERAIGRLPPLYREAFVLRHVEGLSYEEMSEVLEADGSTLRMRVYKARAQLSQELAALCLT
jgi:RNA polymerase sigma-70 factor (ECF subfamily)